MMLALLAAIALQGSTDLFRQVVPHPTGQNGYEEYVRAAELLKSSGTSDLLDWRPEELAGVKAERSEAAGYLASAKTDVERAEWKDTVADLDSKIRSLTPLQGKTLLEVRRIMAERGQKAYLTLEAGNRKPSFSPRSSISLETLYPELAHFKSLAKFIAFKAYAEVADGNGSAAARTLAEGFTFQSRFGTETLIARLVSMACGSILNAALDDLFHALPERGMSGLQKAISLGLPTVPAISSAMESESRFINLYLGDLDKDPKNFGLLMGDPEGDASVLYEAKKKEFEALSPASRQKLFRAVIDDSATKVREVQRVLSQPEAQWFDIADLNGDDSLRGFLINCVSPVFSSAYETEARARTQSRLGMLACDIWAYRWRHGKLPETLADATGKDAVKDPLSGQDFEYAPLLGGTFRLVSKGNKRTGEIALRYKRPKGAAPDPDLP